MIKSRNTNKPAPTSRIKYRRPSGVESRFGSADLIPSFTQSVGSFIVEVAKVVIISLAIIVPVRYFLIQPFYVKGASMEPNFYDNEYLVIDEISYRFSDPKRGDVVVLRNPRHESDFFIKRIIGLPGERVAIEAGRITIYNLGSPSGFLLDEREYLGSDQQTTGSSEVTLSEDQYFVLGDNRGSSLDSRFFGPVQRREIIGRTWIRAWPVNRFTIFSPPSYQINPL